jgi:hypothetical protein
VKEAGMRSKEGVLPDGLILTDLNDQGSTFAEIANVIEKHWEEL